MEGNGKGGSSSSISSQLFGTHNHKGSSPSSANANSSSSSGVFDSVFSTSSTYPGRESSRSQFGSWRKQESEHQGWNSNSKQGSSGNTQQSKEGGGVAEGQNLPNKDRSSIFHDETVEQPCYLSSSLYYGGQDMYSNPSNARTSGTPHIFKKDGGGEDDPNGSNLNSASRGNWWQGSLYY